MISAISDRAHTSFVSTARPKIFALSHISNGDAVIGGSSVKTMEDLKGKKVAYSSGTSSEDILNNTLTKAGMTMSDIQAVDMDASGIVTAMISRRRRCLCYLVSKQLKDHGRDSEATKLAG